MPLNDALFYFKQKHPDHIWSRDCAPPKSNITATLNGAKVKPLLIVSIFTFRCSTFFFLFFFNCKLCRAACNRPPNWKVWFCCSKNNNKKKKQTDKTNKMAAAGLIESWRRSLICVRVCVNVNVNVNVSAVTASSDLFAVGLFGLWKMFLIFNGRCGICCLFWSPKWRWWGEASSVVGSSKIPSGSPKDPWIDPVFVGFFFLFIWVRLVGIAVRSWQDRLCFERILKNPDRIPQQSFLVAF